MKKLVCLAMTLCLLFAFCAFGCGTAEKNASDEGYILLNDFEDYGRNFESLLFRNYFGRIDVNTDKQFVTSGEQSAKVMPFGDYYTPSQPTLYIPFYSTRFNYNYEDLSDIEYLTLDVFNTEETDVTMYYSFVFSPGESAARGKSVTLNPGLNNVKIATDLDLINLYYDITECTGIHFRFDNVSYNNSRDMSAAPVLYMDNIRLVKYREPFELSDNLIVLDPGEICGFDKTYQQYIFTEGSSSNNELNPVLNVVEAENNVIPVSGKRMLKVEVPHGAIGGKAYSIFTFSPKLKDAVDFSQYADSKENYALCADFYNASRQTSSATMIFVSGPGGYGVDKSDITVTVNPGEWTTCRVPLTNFLPSAFENNVDIQFVWYETDFDRTFYLDNIRIERVK